jgi:ribose 5-phosphate isomerase B
MNEKPISVGADALAIELKRHLLRYLDRLNIAYCDHGVGEADASTPYPDIAYSVANSVLHGVSDRGILLCGTGIGMAITANKFPGIRAAVCHDLYSAERSRKSNDCQILCLGACVISPAFAETILDVWLYAEFRNGRSTPKLQRLAEIENRLRERAAVEEARFADFAYFS